MAEPQGNFSNIARGVQRVHCAGVPKRVRRNAFLPKRRLLRAGCSNVLCQNVFEPGSGHEVAASILEERRAFRVAADFQPITKGTRCLLPQRKDSLSSTFTYHVNAGLWVERQIRQLQSDQL